MHLKKGIPVPKGFRQISIKRAEQQKSHTYIERYSVIHSENGDYPCSFSIRNDEIQKKNNSDREGT